MNSPMLHACHVPLPIHSSWTDHPNNIWWGVQIMKLLSRVKSSLSHPNILLSTMFSNTLNLSYVYGTVHHCDSWRTGDQLNVTSYYVLFHFFYAQNVSDIIHPSSGSCNLSILSPHLTCVLVSMCVGVSVWLGWGGIRVAGFSLLHGCVIQ